MIWEEFKKSYSTFEKAIIIVQDYMELGGYIEVANKYGPDRYKVAAIVNGNKERLQEEYPILYNEFKSITNKNFAKKGDKRVKMQKEDWKIVKNKYKGIDLARFVMKEAVELGGIKGLEIKYNVTANNFAKIINRYREAISYKYPNEMKLYIEKVGKRGPKKGSSNKEKNDSKKKFRPKVLDILGKEILDLKFLDYVLKFNTEELTGEKLIRIANERGIKVYELTNDGNKRFIEG